MLWLTEAGLMRQECRVSKPDLPLEAYRDGAFKGFMLDVGLLAAKARLQPRTVLDGSRIFEEFKGALTEQFVQQEIVAELGEEPHYWASPRGDRLSAAGQRRRHSRGGKGVGEPPVQESQVLLREILSAGSREDFPCTVFQADAGL